MNRTQRTFTNYLDGLENLGIEPSLEGISALCNELDNPQSQFDVIQVTGTNGKTSTARIIQTILSAHGLKVGVYTSPHLLDYRERIAVDGEEIGENEFTEIGSLIREKVLAAEMGLAGRKITQFEVITAAALEYFSRQSVKVAVLEVGMGARWDATSIVEAKVGVITDVSLDHAAWLGPKLTDIAAEKAYVIKENNQVIVGPVSTEIMSVFEKRAQGVHAGLLKYGQDFSSSAGEAGKIEFSTPCTVYSDIKLSIGGPWQTDNALLGTVAAETYLHRTLEAEAVRDALFEVTVPGRAELKHGKPDILLDGAHNPAGVTRLLQFLKSEHDGRCIVFLLSILKDKNVKDMIREFCMAGSEIVLTTSDNPRSCDPGELERTAESFGTATFSIADPKAGLEKAISIAGPGGLVVVTGSLYLVGTIRKLFGKNRS